MSRIGWTDEEHRLLIENYSKGVDCCTALLPGRTREAVKARAYLNGLTTASRIKWGLQEDDILRRLYPDYSAIRKALPHRTEDALQTRAKHLGIQHRLRSYTGAEVRRLVAQAQKMSLQEVFEANPDRSRNGIRLHLHRAGAIKPAWHPKTGIELLDALRQRCFDHSIELATVGRKVGTPDALGVSGHQRTKSIEAPWVETAVGMLGGELYVEWDD